MRSKRLQRPPQTSKLPVHAQPLTGVDADVERVNQLGRAARKLLGEKRSRGV